MGANSTRISTLKKSTIHSCLEHQPPSQSLISVSLRKMRVKNPRRLVNNDLLFSRNLDRTRGKVFLLETQRNS